MDTQIEEITAIESTAVLGETLPSGEKPVDKELEKVLDSADLNQTKVLIEAQKKRIGELNREAMNHRLDRNKFKDELDQAKEKLGQIQIELEKKNSEQQTNTLDLQRKLDELAAEKESVIERLTKEAADANLKALKIQIGSRYKLPEVLIRKLEGANAEEIEADAKAVKASLPQPNIGNDADTSVSTLPESSRAEKVAKKRAQYGRL